MSHDFIYLIGGALRAANSSRPSRRVYGRRSALHVFLERFCRRDPLGWVEIGLQSWDHLTRSSAPDTGPPFRISSTRRRLGAMRRAEDDSGGDDWADQTGASCAEAVDPGDRAALKDFAQDGPEGDRSGGRVNRPRARY